MMGGGEARYEFRVWGDGLDGLSDRLRSMSAMVEVRESTETYLVSTTTAKVNPKVRDDLLDIKVLVGITDGFEQWGVLRKAKFPVEVALLRSDVFAPLGLSSPTLDRDEYTPSQLVDEVVAPHRDLAAVVVSKRREIRSVDTCTGEISAALVAGRELQTVAVESTDLAALRELRRSLGLDGEANVNYPRAIGNLLGGRFGGH
jgi:hypothetical protein